MNEIKASTGQMVVLGRQGENQARCINFDIIEWERVYGDGTVQLIHKRHGDETPYPCVVTVEDGIVHWAIQRSDVDIPGEGKAELQYFAGDALVKSAMYRTLTMPALAAPTEEAPEAEKGWVTAVLQAGTAASEAAARAEDASLHPPYIGANDNWFVWDTETGLFYDTGISAYGVGPKGDKGDKGDTGPEGPRGYRGYDGAPGYTPVKGVDYFTEPEITEIIQETVSELRAFYAAKIDYSNWPDNFVVYMNDGDTKPGSVIVNAKGLPTSITLDNRTVELVFPAEV